jgi:hypothetical protein
MRRLTAAFLVGTVAVSAAACSGSGSKSLKAERAAAKSTTSSTTLPFESNAQHTPGTLADFVGAKDDVHDVKCERTGGSWNSAGRLTNPTNQSVKYRVYVSFLSGDTTVGLTEFDSGRVAAKATEPFQSGVKVDGSDLHCVLRVERTTA